MIIGELYLIKEFFWFLFPTKELAERQCRWSRAGASTSGATGVAKVLSQNFKCNIFVVEPKTCFVLLEVDDDYYKLLDSNGNIGWIFSWDFSGCFELVKDLC